MERAELVFDPSRPQGADVVDPMPVLCDNALHLFLALRPPQLNMLTTGQNLLYGIWHATALPGGQVLDVATSSLWVTYTVTAEYGRDFIVAAIDELTDESPDQVDWGRTDATGAYDFFDPDVPYVTAEGAWHVACNNGTELVYYVGTESQVCTYWSDAWDVQAVRPARKVQANEKAGNEENATSAPTRRRKVAS